MNGSAYFRLMRFDKPVGIWLLWCPTAWALWAANTSAPSLKLFFYFALGTVIMRAAGCVINDMADKKFDHHVTRTRFRPLTSGELSRWQAAVLLSLLLGGALIIALQLPWSCFYYALLALAITIIYPFCKRFLKIPQLILGVAFAMSIPMVFTASYAASYAVMWWLVALTIFWVIAYDTMYAMVDKTDDERIGIESSARWFGPYDRVIIAFMQLCFHLMWLKIGSLLSVQMPFYFFWLIAGFILIYQQRLIYHRQVEACFLAFRINVYYGLVMWLGLVVSLSWGFK